MTHKWNPTEVESHKFAVHTYSLKFFEDKNSKQKQKE